MSIVHGEMVLVFLLGLWTFDFFLKETDVKVKRKIIQIDEEKCDGCGLCVPSCAEGAIKIVDGKAKLMAEKYCDGLGACLGECPQEALRVIEREAEDFSEEAVEEYLKSQEAERRRKFGMTGGCPSAQIQSFSILPASSESTPSGAPLPKASALSHWPVQIRLVPPTAPFLKGSDLLVAADCTPIAYPNFHQDFIKGKVVMLGCPKFDEVRDYIQKFADLFNTADIKSITAVTMEVPCCQGLPMILKKGMALAGKKIPIVEVIISTKGEILKKQS